MRIQEMIIFFAVQIAYYIQPMLTIRSAKSAKDMDVTETKNMFFATWSVFLSFLIFPILFLILKTGTNPVTYLLNSDISNFYFGDIVYFFNIYKDIFFPSTTMSILSLSLVTIVITKIVPPGGFKDK